MLAVPTRRDETWHYSNLEAVASVWPVQTEVIDVPAGSSIARVIVQDAVSVGKCGLTHARPEGNSEAG